MRIANNENKQIMRINLCIASRPEHFVGLMIFASLTLSPMLVLYLSFDYVAIAMCIVLVYEHVCACAPFSNNS